VEVLLQSEVQHIEPDAVTLKTEAGVRSLPNQVVIVCAGGVLPTPLLQRAGIEFSTKYGTA
jgi:NADH dehydrogenase FAD-containing subunit